jgi:hypothetical protein
MMWPSLEIKWFFSAQPCAETEVFEKLPNPEQRTDWYAFPCHEHCGIKMREGKLEVKLLLEDCGDYDYGNIKGRLQRWGKWSAPWDAHDAPSESLLQATGWVAIEKVRYQQMFIVTDQGIFAADDDRPGSRCQLEWTALTVKDQSWWSIGVEAWEDDKALANRVLTVIKERLLGVSFAVLPDYQNSFGYAKWLNTCRLDG